MGQPRGADGAQRIYCFFESLRMALVIASHHKYIQLSSSNFAFTIHSRMDMHGNDARLWASIIISRCKHECMESVDHLKMVQFT